MTLPNSCPKPPKREKKERKPLRRTRIKPNRKKKAERFKETYDSPEYVEMIHALYCAVCEVYGFTEAAHVKRRSQGGKAEDLVPLCGNRLGVVGCHHKFDNYDPEIREYEPYLRAYAKRLWRAFKGSVAA